MLWGSVSLFLVFNRNQGNIKSARIEIMKADKEKEYAMGKAEMGLFTAYSAAGEGDESLSVGG